MFCGAVRGVQGPRGVYEPDMGESLRRIPYLPLPSGIVLFRHKAQGAALGNQSLEQGLRFIVTAQ